MQGGFGVSGRPGDGNGLPEDLDLDNFLDSYLVQLQSDMGAPQVVAPPMPPMQQPGLPTMGVMDNLNLLGLLGANGAGGGINLAALQQGLQQGALPGALLAPYGALPAAMPGLALGAGIDLPGLAGSQNMAGQLVGLAGAPMHPLAQQQQQQQQQPPPKASGPSGTAGRPRRAAAAQNPHLNDSSGARSGGHARPSGDDSDAQSSGGSASSGAEPKSRKKREVGGDDDMSVAERRHLALQEKNRRAQRRFRERQKAKIQDLHKQIEELTSKVGNLQTENAALHSRTSILEKVLDMRNEQIQVMQESKEISQHAEDTQDAPPLTLSAVSGHSISLTADMLTPEQIYKIYQTYIKELSVRLVELNQGSPTPSEVTQQVEKLTKEVSFLLMRLSVVRPIETRKFITVSRQYLNTEAEAISMWKNVVNSINLTDQQKVDIVQWKQLFMQKVEPIVEERKKLNVQIQAHLPQESFHTRNAITYIKTHEAVAKLRENLRAEHNVTIEFCAAVFKGVLNSFQMASLLVQAYPAVPDALAVASAVIADMNDQGQTLPAQVSDMPQFEGVNGLSMCAPMVCPPGAQDASQPKTAAAAAAAAAAAGVSQGAAIGLGPTPEGVAPSSLQQMQMAQGHAQGLDSVAALTADVLGGVYGPGNGLA